MSEQEILIVASVFAGMLVAVYFARRAAIKSRKDLDAEIERFKRAVEDLRAEIRKL